MLLLPHVAKLTPTLPPVDNIWHVVITLINNLYPIYCRQSLRDIKSHITEQGLIQ